MGGATSKRRLLLKGMTGDDIRDVQHKLNARHIRSEKALDEDGKFGSETDTAVRDFQRRNGLKVDGKVGDKTWGALDTALIVAAVEVELDQPAISFLGTSSYRT